MENFTENAKITDSGYSNSSSDNRQSQKSERLKKKHKKNSKTTLPVNSETFSEVTGVKNPLKHFFEKKAEDEKAIAELKEITDSREKKDVLFFVDEAGLGPQINLLDDSSFQTIGDFFTIISMSDGLVVFTTPNLYKALGYPKDDRDRKCFIDFICAEDRETFFNGVTKIYPAAQKEIFQGESKSKKVNLFCRLQKTDKQSNQLTGVEKVILSKPCRFTLYVQDLRNHMEEALFDTTFLVVMAQSVQSAYKEPEEYIKSSILFSTLHTVTCHISDVDPEVVQLMGYLPQDMIGRSLFDFYHPEDLHYIKEIYETVLSNGGAPFKSHPYRLIIQNGDSIVLESMLSAHINPWTKKLESVQGLHRVLKGPTNPDVFSDSDKSTIHNEEELQQYKLIQKEILSLLQGNFQRNQPAGSKHFKFLEPVIRNLLNEILPPPSRMDTGMDNRSFSGYTSTVPREISSCHMGESSSNSSTKSMPSYNQLNFEANMDRFFRSNLIITATYDNDDDGNINANNEDEPENNYKNSSEKSISPNDESDLSGSHSAENLRSNFDNQINSETTSSGVGTINYLTESLIIQHTEKMKNIFVQSQKKVRLNIKNNNKQNGSRIITANEKITDPKFPRGQGIKRCRNSSERDDNDKMSRKKFYGVYTNGMVSNNIENKIMNFNVKNVSRIIQNDASTNYCTTCPVNLPDSLLAQTISKVQATSVKNEGALLPSVFKTMVQQNLNQMKEPSTNIGIQQWSDVSEDISSTSSFYSSFLSKSCDGTSSSESKRSNQEDAQKQEKYPNERMLRKEPPWM